MFSYCGHAFSYCRFAFSHFNHTALAFLHVTSAHLYKTNNRSQRNAKVRNGSFLYTQGSHDLLQTITPSVGECQNYNLLPCLLQLYFLLVIGDYDWLVKNCFNEGSR